MSVCKVLHNPVTVKGMKMVRPAHREFTGLEEANHKVHIYANNFLNFLNWGEHRKRKTQVSVRAINREI